MFTLAVFLLLYDISFILVTPPCISHNFRDFVLHCQHDSFLDPSCNFLGFMHNFSQGPSSNSHGSVQQYHRDSSPSLSCNFHSFVLHFQHDFFSDPSCNLCGFMHDFFPGLSCSCHNFVLHC